VAAENLVGRPVAWLMRQVFNLLRAVPEVILALAFIPLFGLTPMAGVLALGVGSIGTLGKLCYEIIEGIQPGPLEAADAVGANRLQRLRWGVLPQVTPELASFVLYRFEVNIRASAVLGLVGAGGIGNDLAQALRFVRPGRARPDHRDHGDDRGRHDLRHGPPAHRVGLGTGSRRVAGLTPTPSAEQLV
jgi:phosphonate transport system permease protein